MDRNALETRWLELTRTLLPEVADARGWPVRLDHCFQRILLDNACGCRWYDAISGRPAFRHAPDLVLERAVKLGEAALTGSADLHELNRNSLDWRGKRPDQVRHPGLDPGSTLQSSLGMGSEEQVDAGSIRHDPR